MFLTVESSFRRAIDNLWNPLSLVIEHYFRGSINFWNRSLLKMELPSRDHPTTLMSSCFQGKSRTFFSALFRPWVLVGPSGLNPTPYRSVLPTELVLPQCTIQTLELLMICRIIIHFLFDRKMKKVMKSREMMEMMMMMTMTQTKMKWP